MVWNRDQCWYGIGTGSGMEQRPMLVWNGDWFWYGMGADSGMEWRLVLVWNGDSLFPKGSHSEIHSPCTHTQDMAWGRRCYRQPETGYSDGDTYEMHSRHEIEHTQLCIAIASISDRYILCLTMSLVPNLS